MEWISIKDKLPPLDKEILCYGDIFVDYYNKKPAIKLCYAQRKSIDSDEIIWVYETTCCGDKYLDNITHWMPLPSSPKE